VSCVFELIVRIVWARLCEGKAQKERPIGAGRQNWENRGKSRGKHDCKSRTGVDTDTHRYRYKAGRGRQANAAQAVENGKLIFRKTHKQTTKQILIYVCAVFNPIQVLNPETQLHLRNSPVSAHLCA